MKNLIENKNYKYGLLFILLGLMMPYFLKVEDFKIYEYIYNSLDQKDSGILVIAAFNLVLLNSFRALPLYLGAFLFTSSTVKKKYYIIYETIIVVVLLRLCYFIISLIYKINYDFGYAAYIEIIVIIILEKYRLYNISYFKRSCIVILSLIGVQFIDVIPSLTKYGFGRGEVSLDIKTASLLIDKFNVLTYASIILMIIFISFAILLNRVLKDQHTRINISLANLERIKLRTDREIKNLVHDLKTPLTSIQALSSVLEITLKDKKEKEYSRKITESVDFLDDMISQILDEDKRVVITTSDLLSYVFSQIINQDLKDKIRFVNTAKDKFIEVNKIRFSRAIINTMNNSYYAIRNKNDGFIKICVKNNNSKILIEIEDNGSGIKANDLDKIWEVGYSNKNSTGIGLAFVKSVIENNKGTIKIDSVQNQWTKATIEIDEYRRKQYEC